MFYGDYLNAHIWATERFDLVQKMSTKIDIPMSKEDTGTGFIRNRLFNICCKILGALNCNKKQLIVICFKLAAGNMEIYILLQFCL